MSIRIVNAKEYPVVLAESDDGVILERWGADNWSYRIGESTESMDAKEAEEAYLIYKQETAPIVLWMHDTTETMPASVLDNLRKHQDAAAASGSNTRTTRVRDFSMPSYRDLLSERLLLAIINSKHLNDDQSDDRALFAVEQADALIAALDRKEGATL